MSKKFNLEEKPFSTECPEKYCFHWGKRSYHDPYQHCTVKSCIRLDPKAKFDSYEPDEPSLAKDGLPWFYFIPNPELVVEKLTVKYIKESEELWGNRHWDKK